MPPDGEIPKSLKISPLVPTGPEIVPRAEALPSTFRVRRVYTACRTPPNEPNSAAFPFS